MSVFPPEQWLCSLQHWPLSSWEAIPSINPKQWQNALFAKFLCAQKSAPSHAALKRYPEKEPDIKLPPGEKKRNKEIIKKEKGNRRAGVSTAKESDEEGGGGGGQLQSA